MGVLTQFRSNVSAHYAQLKRSVWREVEVAEVCQQYPRYGHSIYTDLKTVEDAGQATSELLLHSFANFPPAVPGDSNA